MRSVWLSTSLALGFALGMGAVGCKAGSECGDVQTKCEAECGGTAEQNICFSHLCSERQLVCNCRLCENVPRDLSAGIDLRSVD